MVAEMLMSRFGWVSSKPARLSNGKKGGEDHQKEVQKAKEALENKYKNDPDIEIREEVRVKTPNGEKGTRFIDVAAVNGKTGEIVEGVQVGKQTKGGIPVSRERKAISDITGASPSTDLSFRPYNN